MSNLDANAQITLLKHTLGSTCQDLYTQYVQLKGTQSGAINNNMILTKEKMDLANELQALETRADTLNREYMDRTQDRSPTLYQRHGLSTRQDWVLLGFFASYSFMCLVIAIYIMIYSRTALRAVGMFALMAAVIGVFISKTIATIA